MAKEKNETNFAHLMKDTRFTIMNTQPTQRQSMRLRNQKEAKLNTQKENVEQPKKTDSTEAQAQATPLTNLFIKTGVMPLFGQTTVKALEAENVCLASQVRQLEREVKEREMKRSAKIRQLMRQALYELNESKKLVQHDHGHIEIAYMNIVDALTLV